jgi:hypothetical protein
VAETGFETRSGFNDAQQRRIIDIPGFGGFEVPACQFAGSRSRTSLT